MTFKYMNKRQNTVFDSYIYILIFVHVYRKYNKNDLDFKRK